MQYLLSDDGEAAGVTLGCFFVWLFIFLLNFFRGGE